MKRKQGEREWKRVEEGIEKAEKKRRKRRGLSVRIPRSP